MTLKTKNTIISFLSFLEEKSFTLSIAESCTGGLFSKLITDIPGSSKIFQGCIVAYSNETKMRILSVNKSTLKKHGAVSKNTAYEMVKGLTKYFNTDIMISITGIAGPASDNTLKPVGLVWIGIKIKDKITIYKNNFKGSRNKIRHKAVEKSIELAMENLN